MSIESDFLISFAHAITAVVLYGEDHPARARAIDVAFEHLSDLQSRERVTDFSFLGDDILLRDRPIPEMKGWPWGTRLAKVGMQRLEFHDIVEREEFAAFLGEVLARLSAQTEPGGAEPVRFPNIRFGAVGIRGAGWDGKREETASTHYSIVEEQDAVEWVMSEVSAGHPAPLAEAEAIVRSLSVALQSDDTFVVPLLRLRSVQGYAATHAINVSLLTMKLASSLQMRAAEVHGCGLAALLHDLGMARIPTDILSRRGALSEAERALIQRHPVEGARLILAGNRQLEVAAAAAYEHHLRPDGSGYPALRFRRPAHLVSRMVRVCDVYDALRTNSSYRVSWGPEQVLDYLERKSGTEFDADVTRSFVTMMRGYARDGSSRAPHGPPDPLGIPDAVVESSLADHSVLVDSGDLSVADATLPT
ncbi:MAG: HD-GYP domain-containing protein [Gemmatimonadaceae bacterium]